MNNWKVEDFFIFIFILFLSCSIWLHAPSDFFFQGDEHHLKLQPMVAKGFPRPSFEKFEKSMPMLCKSTCH
jgi:hypothetical protein